MQHLQLKILIVVILLFPGVINAFDYLQALPDSPIIPKNNPQTNAKIQLGKQLYFDNRLSLNGDVNCNSCHNLAASGDDEGSAMHMKNRNVRRAPPSLWNVAYLSTYYWDARAASLEAQAKDHLMDPDIMNMRNSSLLLSRLNTIGGYKKAFNEVFNSPVITMQQVVYALASFERSLKTPDSRFDLFIKGDKTQLTQDEQRGMQTFSDRGCLSCHFGVNFAGPAPGPALKMGDGFYEMYPTYRGTFYEEKYDMLSDPGRYSVTLDPEHKHMWRVPSLRNVINNAPYFHNDAVNEIEEAVKVMGKIQFNFDLTDAEIADIVIFLKTLTGVYPEITLPRLPENDGEAVLN